MSKPRTHLRAGLGIAMATILGVALMGAAALPSFTPDGTATIRVRLVDSPGNITGMWISGECPAGTSLAEVHYSIDPVSTPPFVGSLTPALAADGTFTTLSHFAGSGEPGSLGEITLRCTDETDTTLGEAPLSFTVQNNLNPLFVAPTDVTAPLLVTIYCDMNAADEVDFRYSTPNVSGHQSFPYTGTAIYSLGSPASLGFAAGDVVTLSVDCIRQQSIAFTHSAFVAITAAVSATAPTPPAPEAPSAVPSGPTLPPTGTDNGGWMPAGLAFLVVGLGILALRRRRRAA